MIEISLSERFFNKPKHGIPKVWYNSFTAAEISVKNFIAHVLSGKAWAVGVYKNDHRSKVDFISSWVLALDLDDLGVSVADCLKNADIGRYAALIHPSPSSLPSAPKTRIVFVLDKPLNNREKWELAARAVLYKFRELQPDDSCKDAARFYYGSNIGEPHENPNARLPLTEVAGWVDAYKDHVANEEIQVEQQLVLAPGVPANSSREQAYAEAAFTAVINEFAVAQVGGRNQLLNKAAWKLFSMARGGWPGITDARIENELMQTARAIGFDNSFTQAAALATLRSAKNAAVAKLLVLSDKPQALEHFDIEKAQEDGRVYQQATMNSLQSVLAQALIESKKTETSRDDLLALANKVNTVTDSLLSMSGKISVLSGTDASKKALQLYNETLANPGWIQGLRSNIKSLDYVLGGFPGGQCYTFLGSTGTGKTTLAATLTYNFALQAPGIVFSMENTMPIYMMKLWAYMARIPFGEIRRGGAMQTNANNQYIAFVAHNEQQKAQIKSAQSHVFRAVNGGQLYLPEVTAPTPSVIKALVRRYAGHIKWIIIDSLNNVALPYQASEYETVTRAALLVEQLAVDYDLTVVNTVQIGRNTKQRANKEPSLHDARGSGAVEEKAAAVIGLYNHWHHVEQGDIDVQIDDDVKYPKGTVRMKPNKLRDGQAGKPTNVKFLGGCGYYN